MRTYKYSILLQTWYIVISDNEESRVNCFTIKHFLPYHIGDLYFTKEGITPCLWTFIIVYGYVVVKVKSTITPPFGKTHIPIATERATWINSIIGTFHLITNKRSHTTCVCCQIATQSVFHYFAFCIFVTYMATIKFAKVLPFFGITTSIRVRH